jgi:hypothetical protein
LRGQGKQNCHKEDANSVVGNRNEKTRASNAPTTDPRATGPAMGPTMFPLTKYVLALAAAVTPIMKFEVADETLIGRRSA